MVDKLSIRAMGVTTRASIDRHLKLHGGTEQDHIDQCIAETITSTRTRYPDLPLARLVVDVTTRPCGDAKWTVHTGDHVPNVLDRLHTERHAAASYVSSPPALRSPDRRMLASLGGPA